MKASGKTRKQNYGKAKKEDLREVEAEILEIEKNIIAQIFTPQVWAQDVTPEHLGTLMSRNQGKMSILSTEGGIFDIIGGRYSNGVPNLDLFLQSHSGDPVRVDRGSRESVYIDNPCLSLGLSPQPDVLRGLSDKPGFRGRGLLARNLYFLPTSNLGYRTLKTSPVTAAVENEYQKLIYSLLNIEPQTDDQGKVIPYILRLSPEAFQEWFDFSIVVESDLRDGGRFEHLRDWAGKLPGAAVRIAGLLHCVDNPSQPWTTPISLETIQRALEIASVFSSHAIATFDLMGADKALDGSRKVWRWIEKNRAASFSKRECFRSLQGTFPRATDLNEPLKILAERSFVRAGKKESTGVGRPSDIYKVNPVILKGWS
jgi:hypothetical protein